MRDSTNETINHFNESINEAADWVDIFFGSMPVVAGEKYSVEFYAGVCEGYVTANITVFESLEPLDTDYINIYGSGTTVHVEFDVLGVWEYVELILYDTTNGGVQEGTQSVYRTDPWTQPMANFTGLIPGYGYKATATVWSYGKQASKVNENQTYLRLQNVVPRFGKCEQPLISLSYDH